MKILLFTLLTSLVLVVACSSNTPEEEVYMKEEQQEFKEDWKENYSQQCINSVGDLPVKEYFNYCSCAGQHFIDNYSVEELMDKETVETLIPTTYEVCADFLIPKDGFEIKS